MSGTPHYLEIVTPNVDDVCATYANAIGVAFSDPDGDLGGARIALLEGGTRLGVRAPLRPDEGPLWRVYLRVDDLDRVVARAREAGGEVAIERMALGGGHGSIAVVTQGGVEHGYWEVPV